MADEGTDPRFSNNVLGAIQEHISLITELIKKHAIQLANDDLQDKDQPIGIVYVAQALNDYAPGHIVPKQITDTRQGKWEVFFSYVSPLTIISSLLAILFAVLGLWASGAVGDLPPDKIKLLDGKAYMDIAKIFAGAIVGSATASAASAIKRGKK